jgi:hypothetical protein
LSYQVHRGDELALEFTDPDGLAGETYAHEVAHRYLYGAAVDQILAVEDDSGDVNLYRYCGNSPVINFDPSGLCFQGVGISPWTMSMLYGSFPDPTEQGPAGKVSSKPREQAAPLRDSRGSLYKREVAPGTTRLREEIELPGDLGTGIISVDTGGTYEYGEDPRVKRLPNYVRIRLGLDEASCHGAPENRPVVGASKPARDWVGG